MRSSRNELLTYRWKAPIRKELNCSSPEKPEGGKRRFPKEPGVGECGHGKKARKERVVTGRRG